MKWPWRRKHHTEGNGHAAAEAKKKAERAKAEQSQLWPDVLRARDELARMAERAMRRPT